MQIYMILKKIRRKEVLARVNLNQIEDGCQYQRKVTIGKANEDRK